MSRKKWVVHIVVPGETISVGPFLAANAEAALEAVRRNPNYEFILEDGKIDGVDPCPVRLLGSRRVSVPFEIPNNTGHTRFPLVVHERVNGVGCEYTVDKACAEDIEALAPVSMVQELTRTMNDIVSDFGLRPRRLLMSFSPRVTLFGEAVEHQARGVTGRDGTVVVQFLIGSGSENTAEGWKGILWHEMMHVRYGLTGRWPTVHPIHFGGTAGPIQMLDALVHFCLDGWLAEHGKPVMPIPTDENPCGDAREGRIWELVHVANAYGAAMDVDAARLLADRLWGRDSDFQTIVQIMEELGLRLPVETPLGRYAQRFLGEFT